MEFSDYDEEKHESSIEILGSPLCEDSFCAYYNVKASYVVVNFKTWSLQRDLDFEHVKKLKESLSRKPHFMGTVKLICDKSGRMRIIDGQHRVLAIKMMIEENPKFEMDLFIELYKTDSLHSETTKKLFKEANSVKNVDKADSINDIANLVVDNLSDEFEGMFVEPLLGCSVNRPKIDKRQLYSKLKCILQQNPELNEEIILRAIICLNKKYSLEPFSHFKIKLRKGSSGAPMYDKSRASGCFLGLKKDCTWLEELDFNEDFCSV